MASIDERVVAMSFENAKFEAGAAKTMATLTKLDATLRKVGTASGLGDIDKAANKVTFGGLSAAADKIQQKLHFDTRGITDIEGASNKVTMTGLSGALDAIKSRIPSMSSVVGGALDKIQQKLGFDTKGISDIERAGNAVTLSGANKAADILQQKLAFDTRGITDIEAAAGRVTLGPLNSAVDSVTAKFSALTVAATAALSTIVMDATRKGREIANSLTLGPITQGLEEYATNLNSIQTILANTEASGADLKDVNRALDELNHYSDQTIYNFSEMAKNIGTFTAAGVDLETATGSIKGIANLAALSGSNSQQASTAMYQLSQAISSGRVSLQDWNSVVNAGMGGTVFQRALAQTAVAMGKLDESAVTLKGKMKNVSIEGESFRNSIMAKPGEESWLSSDVLTATLEQFTGDLSKADLAAQGFTDSQIKAILKQAETAKKAATEVKTLKGVMDVTRESIASGWASSFRLIFGDFEEAKKTFTGLSTFISDFVGKSADARNKLLGDWKELGGRTALIDTIKNAFGALVAVLKPLRDAFREIFPAQTGKTLYDLTVRIRDFTESLKIGPETADKLRRAFAGFFAILDIGKTIVTTVLGGFIDRLKELGGSGEGFLGLGATIGDFFVNLRDGLKSSDGFLNFLKDLGGLLTLPIQLLGDLAGLIRDIFGGGEEADTSGIRDAADSLNSSLSPMAKILDSLGRAWERFMDHLGVVGDALAPLFDKVGTAVSTFVDAIGNAFAAADYDQVFRIIETTFIGGIFLAIKKALGGGIGVNFSVFKDATGALDSVTGSLKAMQRNLQADTLLKIATAVAVLAAGMLAISLIDAKKLPTTMTAIVTGISSMVGALALLSKIGGTGAFITLPIMATGLVAVAGAMVVLAGAMLLMSRMSWEEIAKGLVAVGGGLTAIGIATKLMGPGLILIGPGLIAVAGAMILLSGAMKIFATMKWEEIGKGLLGVAGGLTAIGVGLTLIGPSVLLIGPGLIGVAVALGILSGAILALGSMDLATLAKGIVAIGAALVAIGIGIMLIPPTVALQAAGLLGVAVALNIIAAAVALLGNLDISTLVKGIGSIGAVLVVLAVGLTAMAGTLPGAAALLVAAGALAILAPAIGFLGSLKLMTIVKGLVAIGAAIGVLALAGTFAAPALTALGIALLPLAGVMLILSGSIYILAKGLSLLSDTGTKSVAAVLAALTAFVAVLPKIAIDFVKGLVEIIKAVAEVAPEVVAAVVKILENLIEVVIRAAPKLAQAFIVLIREALRVLVEVLPQFITAGAQILVALLKGIADNIAQVTRQVGDIVINFLTAVTAKLPDIIRSGANALVAFLKGIADNLPRVIKSAARVILEFLTGITAEMPKIIEAGAKLVVRFIQGITNNIERVVEEGGKLVGRIIKGIGEALPRLLEEGAKAAGKFIKGLADAVVKLADDVASAVIRLMNGVADIIDRRSGEFAKAAGRIAGAIVKAIARAIPTFGGEIVKAVKELVGDIDLGGMLKDLAGSLNPLKLVKNNLAVDPLFKPITKNAPDANQALDTVSRSIANVARLLEQMIDADPKITPILDLSLVEAEARRLGDMFLVPMTVTTSSAQAGAISEEQQVVQAESIEATAAPTPTLMFEQNNYSPDPLSDVEIYRQTRNQLSQAKSLLGV